MYVCMYVCMYVYHITGYLSRVENFQNIRSGLSNITGTSVDDGKARGKD